MVAVSAYMGGTCNSGVLASAGDVLEISVERCVGGMYDMCMCLARGGVGGVWVTGLGLGFTNSGGTWGKWDMCFVVGGVGGEWVAWARVWEGGVMPVCVVSLDSLCRWQVHISVYFARWIPAHLRCTQYSIMLHLIDI